MISKQLVFWCYFILCEKWGTFHAKERSLPNGNFQHRNDPLFLNKPLNGIKTQDSTCNKSLPGEKRCLSVRNLTLPSSWSPINSIPLGPCFWSHIHLPLLGTICPAFCGFLSLLVQRHHGGLGLYFWSLQVVNTVPVPSGLGTTDGRELSGNRALQRWKWTMCSPCEHNRSLGSCWGSSCSPTPHPYQALPPSFLITCSGCSSSCQQ